MTLTGALLRSVWVEPPDMAHAGELDAIPAALQLPATRLTHSRCAAVQARCDANSQRAIEAGVFGAPTYAIEGELCWGQARPDFVQRRLSHG